NRARVVEARRQRDQAFRAQQPERRLVADDAAERGGEPDRSAGVRAERAERHAGRERGAGPCARAARRAVWIPGIARRWEVVGERRRRESELVRGELAENDRALSASPRHEIGLALGDVAG